MSDVDDMQSWIDDASESLGRRTGARPGFDEVMRRLNDIGAPELAEGELTGFVADAREGLDRRIDAARQSASFDDVMARAHAHDPVAVDESKLAEARRLAPVVDLQRRSAGERAFGAFVDDARAGVVAKIGARSKPAVAPTRTAKPSRMRAVIGVMAVAAVALFAVAATVGLPDVLEQQRAEDRADAEQSQLIEEHEQTRGEASRVGPERAAKSVRADEPDDEIVEAEPEAEPELPTLRHRRAADRTPMPSLSELAGLAKTQWRAGELAAAEQTLTRIVERGGTSRWADNAFSDLFALSHRRGDARAQQRWWKAYLRRFPRGRFADDAQAGLCRASSKRACWAGYLERFPEGSYRGEARRMVDGG